ncbi:MAG: proprotein convertase P-domain-containing protein, partial [Bacteroidota bacterium]
YQVRLAVRNNNFGIDPLGCRSTNAATKYVKVMPTPDFTGTTGDSVSINCSQTVTLNANVTSQTKTQSPPSFTPAIVSLPDGTGSSFITSLDFTGLFPAGAKVTAGCYPTLKFDLEHSWARDLTIELIAPTGQSVKVFDRLQNSGTVSGIAVFGACVNNDDAVPPNPVIPGCPATYTVVKSGGVSWTEPSSVTPTPTPCSSYTGPCLTTSPGTGGSTIQYLYLRPLTYNSQNSFTAFNGADLNGVWSLKITDNRAVDDGVLTNWSLSFPTSCYGSLETVTPNLSTAVWSATGSAPAVPAYSTINTPVTNPGADPCPPGLTCVGNKLTNSVTVGPFNSPGNYAYTLKVTDEFGCSYQKDVNVSVSCPVTCVLNLTSAAATTNQTACVSAPITPITYAVGGDATGVNVTGLSAGITSSLNSGVLTISGTPTTSGNISYNISTVGCTSNLTATGTITINDKPSIPSISAPPAICEAGSFVPSAPTVTDNGSSLTSQGWQIESAAGSGTFNTLTLPYTVA